MKIKPVELFIHFDLVVMSLILISIFLFFCFGASFIPGIYNLAGMAFIYTLVKSLAGVVLFTIFCIAGKIKGDRKRILLLLIPVVFGSVIILLNIVFILLHGVYEGGMTIPSLLMVVGLPLWVGLWLGVSKATGRFVKTVLLAILTPLSALFLFYMMQGIVGM